jgi:hypothetical protein
VIATMRNQEKEQELTKSKTSTLPR